MLCPSVSGHAIQRILTPEQVLERVVQNAPWDLHHMFVACPRPSARTRITIRATGRPDEHPRVRVYTRPRSARLESCVASTLRPKVERLRMSREADESVTFMLSERVPSLAPARSEDELRERLRRLEPVLRGCVRTRRGVVRIRLTVQGDGLSVDAREPNADECLETLLSRIEARGFETELEYRLAVDGGESSIGPPPTSDPTRRRRRR